MNIKNLKVNYKYLFGFILVTYAIIFAFIDIYWIPFKNISGPSGSRLDPGTKPDIAQVYFMWAPWNKLSLIFYFTIHSNIFVLVYMFLRAFNLINPRTNKHAKIFQLIVATNIFVTFLIYWTILAPIDNIWNTPLKILDNFQLHLMTPLIMLFAFVFETSRRSANQENISLKNIELLYSFIFPILWLIMAITLYYATRKNIYLEFKYSDNTWSNAFQYKFGIAIYPFLAFDITPVWLPIVCLISIIAITTFIAYLLVVSSRHESWIYKFNDYVKERMKKLKK